MKEWPRMQIAHTASSAVRACRRRVVATGRPDFRMRKSFAQGGLQRFVFRHVIASCDRDFLLIDNSNFNNQTIDNQ